MLVCFRKGRKCSLPSGVAVCAPYGMSETAPILKFNLRCGAAHPANRSLQVRRWCFAVVGTVGEGTHNRAHWASLSCWVSPDHGTAPHSAAMGYRSLILLALFAGSSALVLPANARAFAISTSPARSAAPIALFGSAKKPAAKKAVKKPVAKKPVAKKPVAKKPASTQCRRQGTKAARLPSQGEGRGGPEGGFLLWPREGRKGKGGGVAKGVARADKEA